MILTDVLSIPAVQDKDRFLIQLPGAEFLNRDGNGQNDCKSATAFSITSEGQLTVQGDPENVFSVDVGVDSEPFEPSKPGAAIQDTFDITGNTLTWKNPTFLDGVAVFCVEGTGITAYFQGAPGDCETYDVFAQDSKFASSLIFHH